MLRREDTNMKKIFAFMITATCYLLPAACMGATNWWLQPTICKPVSTKCWTESGAGIDATMWDAASNCWGMKLICGEALVPSGFDSEPIPKSAINSGTGVNKDFDFTERGTGACYGVRKTTNGGAMASVNGKSVKVWCRGVLPNPDETMPNGEITYGADPTCSELADYGYAGTLNGNCYGKKYNQNDYYIECADPNAPLPSRIVELRGATGYRTGTSSGTGIANTTDLFNDMYNTSRAAHAEHFNN